MVKVVLKLETLSSIAGPGGIHEFSKHQNCTGGIVGHIDRLILRESHVYQWARIRTVYDSQVFEPEGIFGCLMAIVQVFFGVQFGATLLTFSGHKDRLIRWGLWGVGCGMLTGALTFFSIEDGPIPMNKQIWSFSFVTVTTCQAFLLLSLIYLLKDVKNLGDDFWTIFSYPGMNAIILYVGHFILHTIWPFNFALTVMNTHFILLLENVYTVIVWILVSHYLFHKKIFYSL